MTSRQSLSSSFMMRLSRVIPALFTRMAIGPMSASTWSTSPVAPSTVEMSPRIACARSPIAALTLSAASAFAA